VLRSRAFELFSACCNVLNLVCLLIDHPDKTVDFATFLRVSNFLFYLVLCAEVLLHLLAQGPRCLSANYWILFDLCIAIGISAAYFSGSASDMRRAQSLRLARIVKVIATFKVY
jgi:predicted permease